MAFQSETFGFQVAVNKRFNYYAKEPCHHSRTESLNL